MPNTYVVDVDGTICWSYPGCDYSKCDARNDIIQKINECYDEGDTIILFTARGMRSYNGDIESINKHVRPVLEKWLEDHKVKYHELIMGKPWFSNMYYIDDRSLSIKDFISLSRDEYDNAIKKSSVM